MNSLCSNFVNVCDFGADSSGGKLCDDAFARASRISSHIFVPAGIFTITSFKIVSGMRIKGVGADSVIQGGNGTSLFHTDTTCKNVTIECLHLRSIVCNIATFLCLNSSIKDMMISDVIFSDSGHLTNAIKIVGDKSNHGVQNVSVERCIFVDIGRMAVEVQNHGKNTEHWVSNVTISKCLFRSVGKIGLKTAGMGISLSGLQSNNVINGNYFCGNFGPDLEIVGSSYSKIFDNHFVNSNDRPLQFSNKHPMVGNVIFHNKVIGGEHTRDVYICNASKSIVFRNVFNLSKSMGYVTIKGGYLNLGGNLVFKNIFITKSYYSVIIDNCRNNLLFENKIDNSLSDNNYSTIRLYGSQTTNNIIFSNEVVESGSGKILDQYGGAISNIFYN